MQIAAVGRAFPPHYYDQDQLLVSFREHWAGKHFNMKRLERLHRNVLVGGRHLALPMEDYPRLETWGQANDAWIRVAQGVGAAAVRDALERAGLGVEDVDALYTVTVTGVATPSLDARLVNRLGPEHPFHLHGQFLTISPDGRAATEQPGLKDTVLVPGQSTVEVTAYMDNPGRWMAHCHILEHAELGMMSEFGVEPAE